MKDYTKYDFAAIVGAKVKITLVNGHTFEGALKLVDKKNKAIFLCPNEDLWEANWFLMEGITDLSAEITIEDMSVKHLKRRFSFDCKFPLVLVNDKTFMCHISDGKIDDVYGETSIHEIIDCTDWGWKDE